MTMAAPINTTFSLHNAFKSLQNGYRGNFLIVVWKKKHLKLH